MGEDQNETGEIANQRLLALLEALGWKTWVENRDMPCTIRSHRDTDTHGVDGYMSYDDPYINGERGIIVESKSKKWSGWNDSSLDDAASQTLDALECVPNSDKFKEVFDGKQSRTVDTAIIGAYTNEGEYDQEKFSEYVDSLEIRKKGKGPFKILVLDNADLNRLASLHAKFSDIKSEFDGPNDSVGFYYPSLPDSVSERADLVSLEYLLSDFLYAKVQTVEQTGERSQEPKDINIVFHFDDVSYDSLDFMFQSLVEYQLLDSDEVWVFYDEQDADGEDLDSRTVVEGFVKNQLPADVPRFKFRPIPNVEFESHVDNMIGE